MTVKVIFIASFCRTRGLKKFKGDVAKISDLHITIQSTQNMNHINTQFININMPNQKFCRLTNSSVINVIQWYFYSCTKYAYFVTGCENAGSVYLVIQSSKIGLILYEKFRLWFFTFLFLLYYCNLNEICSLCFNFKHTFLWNY